MADEIPLYMQTPQNDEVKVAANQYYAERADTFMNRFRKFMMQIWPYCMQFISFILYETLKIGKASVKMIIEQLKFK